MGNFLLLGYLFEVEVLEWDLEQKEKKRKKMQRRIIIIKIKTNKIMESLFFWKEFLLKTMNNFNHFL